MAKIVVEAPVFEVLLESHERRGLEIVDHEVTKQSMSGYHIFPSDESGSEPDEDTAQPRRRGRGYLICLTISAGGLQVVWATIMGQGTPFLSSLGIPAHVVSFIWLAGPLSGAIIQPYISVLSDRLRSPWGHRRPFILFGAILTMIYMTLLPWTGEMADMLSLKFSKDPDNKWNLIIRSCLAGLLIWAVNISIQPMQVGIRALVVDCCPPQQQVQATSYVSSITAVGSIVGYTLGFMDLAKLLPWLGNTQYQCLFAIASILLIGSMAITCYAIDEKAFKVRQEEVIESKGVLAIFKQVIESARLMPESMKLVCWIQFYSWLGWFPFLFYMTTYLGDIRKRENSIRTPGEKGHSDPTSQQSDFIRQGTMTMIIFATISLASNMLLPLIITTKQTSSTVVERADMLPSTYLKLHPPTNHVKRLRKSKTKLSLPRAWAVSQLLLSLILLTTIFTSSSVLLTTIQVSLLGVSWAMTQWAPLALISTLMASHEASRNETAQDPGNSPCQIGYGDGDEDVELIISCTGDSLIGNATPRVGGDHRPELRAGVVMGIYNVSIAAPQILAAVSCSCLFWILGRLGLSDGEAVGWVIRLGGLSTLAAAWLTIQGERVKKRVDLEEEA